MKTTSKTRVGRPVPVSVSEPEPVRVRVGAVQMRMVGTVAEHVEAMVGQVAAFARGGGEVLLFPECAVTGYGVDFGALDPVVVEAGLARVAAAAREHGCAVLVGAPTRNRYGGGKRWLNSLVVIDRRGREVFRYDKIHLTPRDEAVFERGRHPAVFEVGGVPGTAIICHERRYPELVRLPVMLGARVVFHPNAGLDTLAVSRGKRGGRDGIAVRAFENQVAYVFANSVGPQGGGLWSAGDSKIVGPDMRVLAQADNRSECRIEADLDLGQAGGKYAREALRHPAFLRPHWKAMLAACRKAARGWRGSGLV